MHFSVCPSFVAYVSVSLPTVSSLCMTFWNSKL